MHLQAMGLLINLQTVQRLNITVLSAVNSTVSDSYSGLNALLKYEVAIFVYLSFKSSNDRGFFSIYYFLSVRRTELFNQIYTDQT